MGIEFIRLACPLIGSAFLERVLQLLDVLAHGLAAAAIGLALALAGLLARNRRLLRVGLAVLVAAAVAGLAANGLKLVFQVPRPHTPGSYSFPSGHATTAFAVAAVLARAFPPAGPLFAFVALFGGLARVYFRDHYLIDVVAGGLLGAVIGLSVAPLVFERADPTSPPARARAWAWILLAAVGIPTVAWFSAYERQIGAHRTKPAPASGSRQANVAVRFGTPGARPLLRSGWSGDEKWNGAAPFVWAEGTEAELAIPSLVAGNYRARLRVLPLVRSEGLSCQVVDLRFNGNRVGEVLLDRGWNDYEVSIPRAVIRPAGTGNEMRFRFSHAAVPGPRDSRLLAVAFRDVEIFSETASRPPRAGR